MEQAESHIGTKRSSRERAMTSALLIALLEEHASREYRAVLGSIGERQCNSLGEFAMAEHMRSMLGAGAPTASR